MIALLFSTNLAFAQWAPFYQVIKLPDSQQVFEVQSWTAPDTATTNSILSGSAGATSAASATVTTFLAQPDVARNLVITPGGTTADVAAGNVVVVGKDIFGKAITENFAFLANASTATTGNKAFKSITSITFPGEDSPFGATWSVGIGDKLGLQRCIDSGDHIIKGLVDGVTLTGITAAASTAVVSSNTIIPNPASNNSRNFKLFYLQNYRCK